MLPNNDENKFNISENFFNPELTFPVGLRIGKSAMDSCSLKLIQSPPGHLAIALMSNNYRLQRQETDTFENSLNILDSKILKIMSGRKGLGEDGLIYQFTNNAENEKINLILKTRHTVPQITNIDVETDRNMQVLFIAKLLLENAIGDKNNFYTSSRFLTTCKELLEKIEDNIKRYKQHISKYEKDHTAGAVAGLFKEKGVPEEVSRAHIAPYLNIKDGGRVARVNKQASRKANEDKTKTKEFENLFPHRKKP